MSKNKLTLALIASITVETLTLFGLIKNKNILIIGKAVTGGYVMLAAIQEKARERR